MYKGLMIIIDGLGDRPNPELGNMTPLEAASTPWMDKFLTRGICGLVDTLSAGFPVCTHSGTASLMGMDNKSQQLLDRGPVEAAGVGITPDAGDILIRANFATVAADAYSIIDRRAGRISEGTEALAESLKNIKLSDGVTGSLYAATQHRAVIRLQGKKLSPDISNTDPCRMYSGAKRLVSQAYNQKNKKAVKTARALNNFIEYAYTILGQHPINQSRELPANILLTRGAGVAPDPLNLINTLGLKASVISGDKTLHGLARMCGFNVIYETGFTAGNDTDLDKKITATNQALRSNDLVFLHIKATDIFSHSKDPKGKQTFIEKIDKALASLSIDEQVIGVVADHSTSCISGEHCGDPVPALLFGPSSRVDKVMHFSEIDCMQGGLGRIKGSSFLHSMLDQMDCLHNYLPSLNIFIR